MRFGGDAGRRSEEVSVGVKRRKRRFLPNLFDHLFTLVVVPSDIGLMTLSPCGLRVRTEPLVMGG